MQYLRADTITEVTVGPAVAVGDGFVPVTGLVGTSADEFEIIKHGATATTTIAGTLAAITGADGYYALDLSATDTDTEGRLTLLINDDTLILPIRHEFMVVNQNVFDSLFAVAATDVLDVNVTEIIGTAPTLTTNDLDVNVATIAAGAVSAAAVATDAIDDDAIATGAIASTAFAAGAINAAALATDAVTEIANAMLPKINTALADIPFVMVDATDGLTLETGLTVVATVSLNGATSFSATTGTVTEIANGVYSFDADAADMNGALVIFKFTSAGAANTYVTIRTSA